MIYIYDKYIYHIYIDDMIYMIYITIVHMMKKLKIIHLVHCTPKLPKIWSPTNDTQSCVRTGPRTLWPARGPGNHGNPTINPPFWGHGKMC